MAELTAENLELARADARRCGIERRVVKGY